MSDLRSRAEAAKSAEAGPGTAPGAGGTYVGGLVDQPAAYPTAGMPAADVADSDVPADMDVPVHMAWQRMMQDVQWLGKSRRTESGSKYNYRGIDDVMNLVGPAERKHGVFVMPTGIEPIFEVINTKGGAAMNYCRAVCHFTIYGPRGDTMPATVLGEGFDSGDKSGSKAQSVALRTLYLNGLAIQTNEPSRDTEYGVQHEIAGPKAPTAEEYAAEILDETVSIPRLQQIKSELSSNRAMGVTEVEPPGMGGKVRLIDLVQRVGVARMKGQ
jgi:hypothetical protein